MINSDSTVWNRWQDFAAADPDRNIITHVKAGHEPYRWTWQKLMTRANAYRQTLVDVGVKKGDVCALMIRHHPEFYPMYFGISALGAIPSVLAYPNARLHPEKFRQGLEGMSRHSGLDWLLTERELEPVVSPVVASAGGTIRGLHFPLEWRYVNGNSDSALRKPPTDCDSPCLLQHSSGTTGMQKGVVLSNRAVLEHVVRYGASINLDQQDRIISWLPLYHDMGLIAAFYLSITSNVQLVQLDPFEWVMAPLLFLEVVSQEHGTIGWLPNFAYNMMGTQLRDEDIPTDLDLSSLRLLVNCSEPVRAESHNRFLRRFENHGFRENALAACYAMAETTFAVTQTAPGVRATELTVSREDVAKGAANLEVGSGDKRVCVSSGHPISGCEVRIIDSQGLDLADDLVGEIAISSVSLFEEYRNNPAATAAVMKDGWYFSGDYGFRHGGELYVIGRKKDIIIIAGKNIYPEDVEDAIGGVPHVTPGRVVAFGVEDEKSGTESMCIVAETKLESPEDHRSLRRAIVRAGMEIDITINRAYLAPPRWLIKSSSGKPSRKANSERAVVELHYK